jgi:hypothetical protein
MNADAYRFNLVRDLRPVLLRKGPPTRVLGWVMLNPSTAAELNPDDLSGFDDPTIRRCKTFARREGCDGIHICNVSPYRATSPIDLILALEHGVDVFQHERNEAVLSLLAMRSWAVVLAWGQNIGRHPVLRARTRDVERLVLAMASGAVYSLGFNTDGTPRHPVRLANDTAFVEMQGPAPAGRETTGAAVGR